MTKPNNLDVSKKLSPKSIRLLDELSELSIKGADLVPQLYSSLSDDGLEHKEILPLIEERLDIGRRRLYQLLAPEQKRSFTKTKVKQIALSNQPNRRLVVPEEPTLPPPPEVTQEAEIIREPEPKAEQRPKKQTYRLNSKTCKGWPCERDYIYEIEVDEENRNVTRMYAISD